MSRLDDFTRLSAWLRERVSGLPQAYADRLEEELVWIRIYSLEAEILADIGQVSGRDNKNGLVFAWLAGFTSVDPVSDGIPHQYAKGAMDAPDIDSDITPEHQPMVEKHLHELYGDDNVAHVATYLEWGAKGVIKDICRLAEVPFMESGQITDSAQDEPDATITEEWDYIVSNSTPALALHIAKIDPMIRKWGEKWRGLFRTIGKHAAGVVITPDPVGECLPVLCKEGEIICAVREGQETRELTELGYLKADLLGLATCSIIEQTLALVKANGKELPVKSIDHINLDDERVLARFTAGDTSCIFQFTSPGMQKLIMEMKADSFDDIVAAAAIFRPGPLRAGIDKEYVRGKRNPAGIVYAHENMRSALDETHGCMIYQEQQMQILVAVGGFTLAESDQARKLFKILANVKPEDARQNPKLKKLLGKLEDGCTKLGITKDQVDGLLEKFGAFSRYGFNKSHACLASGSLVKMADRTYKPLCQVVVGDLVSAYDPDTGEEVDDVVEKVHNNGDKETFVVMLDNGAEIECTLDHEFVCSDGKKHSVAEIYELGLDVVCDGMREDKSVSHSGYYNDFRPFRTAD